MNQKKPTHNKIWAERKYFKTFFQAMAKKRVLQRKTTLCHVLSAFCGCGTAIDSQTLLKRGWLIYLLQIVVGEKTYHITSWSYFPSPPLASASEPGAGGKGSQRARSAQPGPSRGLEGTSLGQEASGRLQPAPKEGKVGTRSARQYQEWQWTSF